MVIPLFPLISPKQPTLQESHDNRSNVHLKISQSLELYFSVQSYKGVGQVMVNRLIMFMFANEIRLTPSNTVDHLPKQPSLIGHRPVPELFCTYCMIENSNPQCNSTEDCLPKPMNRPRVKLQVDQKPVYSDFNQCDRLPSTFDILGEEHSLKMVAQLD